MTPAQPVWMWCLFPGVAMSLGWMLRGYIGGGFLGAMIPGAMVALALCLLLKRETEAGLVAGFAAVGVGFGGQETYGQTVGLSLLPASYWWAILGFFLKGGVWGLLGGAIIGISFSRRLHRAADLVVAFALMIAGTFVGWKLVNQPKLIYFSDPVNKPREELWFGLLLGAVLLLAWLWLRSRRGVRLPLQFATWGFIGGSAGFALGAAAQVWGRHNMPDFQFDWWKLMEGIFGALLGLAYGYCAWRNREHIPPGADVARTFAIPRAIAWAALSIGITLLLEPQLGTRFESTLAGSLLLTIALFSQHFSWQTGITTTFCAFMIDLVRHHREWPPELAWTLVVAATVAVAIFVARRPRSLDLFLLITWTAVGVGLLKSFFMPGFPVTLPGMEIVFVLFAVLISFLARNIAKEQQ